MDLLATYQAIVLERDAEIEELQRALEEEQQRRTAAEGILERLGALR